MERRVIVRHISENTIFLGKPVAKMTALDFNYQTVNSISFKKMDFSRDRAVSNPDTGAGF
jgi:hypothetical protein